MSTVLVIDDEPPILRTLGVNLRARGYDVQLARTGHEALALAARRHPDAVVLDLGLPDLSGIDVIYGLRGWTSVPIIVLSARTAEAQKVAALDAGANDYVSKPFGMDELMARLRVALRSSVPAEEVPVIETADFTIDLAAKRVRRGDTDVRLTATEWQVVELLARNAGRLVTQRQLLEEVWGLSDVKTNYVRVFMVSIRRKLEPDPSHPRYFLTEPGSGLRFVPEGVESSSETGD
jgi:two-component system KDP operon response regulator KdpE